MRDAGIHADILDDAEVADNTPQGALNDPR